MSGGRGGEGGERLYGAPGADSLDRQLMACIDRQWEWHVDDWRWSKNGVGKPDPLTMTVEEWTTHPPEYHLPTVEHLVEHILDVAADTETDEGWYDQANDAARTPAVFAIAEALRLTIAQGIRYRMAANQVATWTVTRSTRWADGHSGIWTTEDTEPVPFGRSTP